MSEEYPELKSPTGKAGPPIDLEALLRRAKAKLLNPPKRPTREEIALRDAKERLEYVAALARLRQKGILTNEPTQLS